MIVVDQQIKQDQASVFYYKEWPYLKLVKSDTMELQYCPILKQTVCIFIEALDPKRSLSILGACLMLILIEKENKYVSLLQIYIWPKFNDLKLAMDN